MGIQQEEGLKPEDLTGAELTKWTIAQTLILEELEISRGIAGNHDDPDIEERYPGKLDDIVSTARHYLAPLGANVDEGQHEHYWPAFLCATQEAVRGMRPVTIEAPVADPVTIATAREKLHLFLGDIIMKLEGYGTQGPTPNSVELTSLVSASP